MTGNAGSRGGLAVAFCLLLSVVAAGCGSSSTSRSTGSAAASTGSAAAATSGGAAQGKPLKIFTISTKNSSLIDYGGVFASVQAAVRAINSTGGVGLDHRKLEVQTCDNQANPNLGLECAKEAKSSGAVATVGDWDMFSTATSPVLVSEGIPRIGINPLNPADVRSPGSYPIYAGAYPSFLGAGMIFKKLGATKFAGVLSTTPASAGLQVLAKQGVAKAGGTWVGTVTTPGNVTDFTSYAEQVKGLVAKGAQVIITSTGVGPTLALMKTFQQTGGKAQWMEPGNVTPQILSKADGVFDGTVGIDGLPPASATNVPAVAQWNAQMKAAGQAGVAETDKQSAVTFNAWLAVYSLKDLLAKTSGDVTPAKVTSLLKTAPTMRIQNLLDWSPAKAGPSVAPRLSSGMAWLTKITDGKEVLSNPKPVNVFGLLGL